MQGLEVERAWRGKPRFCLKAPPMSPGTPYCLLIHDLQFADEHQPPLQWLPGQAGNACPGIVAHVGTVSCRGDG